MEITDVEVRCSGSSGGGDASGLDPSPVETARALSRGQPPVPRRRRHRQKRKVFWKASAVLALCAVGVTYAHGPGAVDALRSALTHTPARRRLGAKKAICKSVYEKVHPNANKVRGRGYSDGEKEKKRGGGGCNAARTTFGIFAVSVVCVIYLFVGIAIVSSTSPSASRSPGSRSRSSTAAPSPSGATPTATPSPSPSSSAWSPP